MRGKHRVDFREERFSGGEEAVIRAALREFGAEDERLQLLRREHQRRHAVAATHAKPHARFTLDRHTTCLEIGDIAIHRTPCHAQALGDLAAGQYSAASEQERQLKESISSAH